MSRRITLPDAFNAALDAQRARAARVAALPPRQRPKLADPPPADLSAFLAAMAARSPAYRAWLLEAERVAALDGLPVPGYAPAVCPVCKAREVLNPAGRSVLEHDATRHWGALGTGPARPAQSFDDLRGDVAGRDAGESVMGRHGGYARSGGGSW